MNDITKDSIELEWKPPVDDGGLEVTKYIIDKCETKKGIWMKVNLIFKIQVILTIIILLVVRRLRRKYRVFHYKPNLNLKNLFKKEIFISALGNTEYVAQQHCRKSFQH